MNDNKSKYQLNVLIQQNTRIRLSLLFNDNYQYKYPSFSQYIEVLLIKGLDVMEEIDMISL